MNEGNKEALDAIRARDADGNEVYFGKDYMSAVEEFTRGKIA